jgi:hypothetical protein
MQLARAPGAALIRDSAKTLSGIMNQYRFTAMGHLWTPALLRNNGFHSPLPVLLAILQMRNRIW